MTKIPSDKALEHFHAYRDLIKHEDALRNERIKALFTINGVLVAILTFFSKSPPLVLELLCAVGLLTSIYYYFDLRNGEIALNDILLDWESCKIDGLPRIIGKHGGNPFSSLVLVLLVSSLWGVALFWILAAGLPKP